MILLRLCNTSQENASKKGLVCIFTSIKMASTGVATVPRPAFKEGTEAPGDPASSSLTEAWPGDVGGTWEPQSLQGVGHSEHHQ